MSSPNTTGTWGALFDWDGVLVDSKALHEAAWNKVAREFGYPHGPEDFKRHFGTQNRRAIKETLGWTKDDAQIERISKRKEVLYREQLAEHSNLWLPGAEAFVELCASRGIPRALVSSSSRENIDVLLGGSRLKEQFQAIVTADDTRLGKPEPEGFLLGASRLGLLPQRCVVFEDAPAGIQAGLRGGMRVVGLTTTHSAAELDQAHLVVAVLGPDLLREIEAWFP